MHKVLSEAPNQTLLGCYTELNTFHSFAAEDSGLKEMVMVTCQGTTKIGQPCRNQPIKGRLYCRYHKPDEADDPLEVYNRLEKSTPEEKTDIVLQLIKEHPEGKLELPEREGKRARLKGIDLFKFNLQGANLRGANLQGARLSYANFHGADLMSVNLSRATLYVSNLQEAEMVESKLWNADLTGANLQKAQLRGADFQAANLEGADLRETALQGSNFQDALLKESCLQGANLEGANFQGVDLVHVKLQRTFLLYGNFQGACLRGTNLKDAYLVGVNFQGAELLDVNLQSANLSDAMLQQIDLLSCNLRNIHISGAWLDRTRLRYEQLGGAIGEELSGEYEAAKYGYLTLKQNFDDLGDYHASSWAYRKERRMEKMTHWQASKYYWKELSNSNDKSWSGKFQRFRFYLRHFALYISDWIVELLCDYGESIGRVLAWMAAILFVVGPALVGWQGQLTWPEDSYNIYWSLSTPWQQWWYAYVQNVLYMLDTFTTANFAQLKPANDIVRLISGFLAMVGIFSGWAFRICGR